MRPRHRAIPPASRARAAGPVAARRPGRYRRLPQRRAVQERRSFLRCATQVVRDGTRNRIQVMTHDQSTTYLDDALRRLRSGIELPPIDPGREQALLAAFDAHW